MNKSLFAILAVLAASSMLTIGCGTTADFTETEVDWLHGPAEKQRNPGLETTYMESETCYIGGKNIESDFTETEDDHARKPTTIENDLSESQAD